MRFITMLAGLALIAGSGFFAAGAAPKLPTPAPASEQAQYLGAWLDKQKTGLKMEISEDEGLLRIKGGLGEEFQYSLACVVKLGKAACTGSGGKLEGEKFLYESVFQFADGTAEESWKAYNNLQAVDGKTEWVKE